MKSKANQEPRKIRQVRVRKKVRGTDAQPRLCVFKSLKYTYAQLISDDSHSTIASASTRDFDGKEKSQKSVEAAKIVGQKIAEQAKAKNIESIIFDRNGYVFHGRVAAVAEGAREGGLKF